MVVSVQKCGLRNLSSSVAQDYDDDDNDDDDDDDDDGDDSTRGRPQRGLVNPSFSSIGPHPNDVTERGWT